MGYTMGPWLKFQKWILALRKVQTSSQEQWWYWARKSLRIDNEIRNTDISVPYAYFKIGIFQVDKVDPKRSLEQIDKEWFEHMVRKVQKAAD